MTTDVRADDPGDSAKRDPDGRARGDVRIEDDLRIEDDIRIEDDLRIEESGDALDCDPGEVANRADPVPPEVVERAKALGARLPTVAEPSADAPDDHDS